MKGLIPAAGMGTRLGPIALAIPKELLMVGEKACIEHVVEAFKIAGIKDIVIVVGWRKHAILDYFGSGKRLDVNITYVVQDERDGLAKAVECGKNAINHDSFAVILGDNFFYPKTFLKELISFHKRKDVFHFSFSYFPFDSSEKKLIRLMVRRNGDPSKT